MTIVRLRRPPKACPDQPPERPSAKARELNFIASSLDGMAQPPEVYKLLRRITECARCAKKRRAYFERREPIPEHRSRIKYRCKSSICPYCRRYRHISRWSARLSAELAAVPRDQFRIVTVHGKPCRDLDELARQHKATAKDVRNAFRGRSIKLFSVMEFTLCAEGVKPHYHILAAGRVDGLAPLLRQLFLPGPRGLQVKPIDPDKSIADNIRDTVGYACKLEPSKLGFRRQQFAELVAWLSTGKKGVRFFKIETGKLPTDCDLGESYQ